MFYKHTTRTCLPFQGRQWKPISGSFRQMAVMLQAACLPGGDGKLIPAFKTSAH